MAAIRSLEASGEASDGAGPAPAQQSTGRRALLSWSPAVLATAFTVAVLLRFGVPVLDLLRFGAYLLLAIVVPGMLWWRASRGRSSALVEDAAMGACVGLAFEVLTYIGARAIGVPLLVLLWPMATLVAFAAVPRLRRYWRGGPADERPPVLWSWAMSGLVVFLTSWSAWTFYPTHPLSGNESPYQDLPFHLALAGELKNHAPPTVPYVQGERLNYHWFVYADAAATSHVTGIELQTIMYRLLLVVPMVITVLLLGIAARRLTGRWWPGPVAAGIFVLSTPPNPYRWTSATVTDTNPLHTLWLSPTQTFGLALFSGALLLMIDLLSPGDGQERTNRRLTWLLFGVVIAAVMGSKATLLPMLVAGLFLAMVVQVLARRPWRPVALALGITLPAFAFAQLVLFGGTSGALTFGTLIGVRRLGLGAGTGLTAGHASILVLLILLVLVALLWLTMWAGAVGLAVRRRLLDPAVLVLIGIPLAGAGILLSFVQSGASQVYFWRGAGTSLALLAAVGLAAVFPPGRRVGWGLLAVVAGLGLGAVAILLVRHAGSRTPPRAAAEGKGGVLLDLWGPPLVLLAAAGAVGLALLLLGRRSSALRGISLVVVLSMAMGFQLPTTWQWVRPEVELRPHPVKARPMADGRPEILADGIAAARWLRDHSSADDLVATNGHCRPVSRAYCDNRHFWISAFSERRVLVEGWGYTDTANNLAKQASISHAVQPYWNQERLADNDAAFLTPSAQTVGRLRDRYGVRWLFVENRLGPTASPELARYATLRFQRGDFAVYEI